jgi:hypothetical protein
MSNPLVAVWGETLQGGMPLYAPDYGRVLTHDKEQVSVVPSLTHYTTDRRRWVDN